MPTDLPAFEPVPAGGTDHLPHTRKLQAAVENLHGDVGAVETSVADLRTSVDSGSPRSFAYDFLGLATAQLGTWNRTAWSPAVDGRYRRSGGLGNYWEFAIVTDAGTWTFDILHHQAASGGILTVTVDGASVGTIDCYAASDTANVFTAFTGISLTAGRHTVRMEVTGQNASSSGFIALLQRLYGARTGA
jgi:hypothetical protein